MGFDAPAPTPIVSKKIEPTSTPSETIVHNTSEPEVDKKSYVDAFVIRSPDRVQRPNQSRPNPGANQSRNWLENIHSPLLLKRNQIIITQNKRNMLWNNGDFAFLLPNTFD